MSHIRLPDGVLNLRSTEVNSNQPNIVADQGNSFVHGSKPFRRKRGRKAKKVVPPPEEDDFDIFEEPDRELFAGTIPFVDGECDNEEDGDGFGPVEYTRNLIEKEAHMAVASQFGKEN